MKNLITKILLIDDDDSFYNILKPRLARKGLFLIWAKDGEEGFEKAKIEMPHLVITDIVMPKSNGFDVIRRIKTQPLTAGIQFVVLSSWGESRFVYNKEFLDSLGIKKYLIKSLHTPSEIAREIISLVS